MADQGVSNQGSLTTDNVDKKRRNLLIASTSAVGAAGVAAIAVPFVASMLPSERARAAGAPVEADVSKLEAGQLVIIEWRGRPVWVVRRTPEMLATLQEPQIVSQLRDPDSLESIQPEYAQNQDRSTNPEILVMLGVCTHLGCSPTFRPDLAPADLGSDWAGGFFCPCHGSKFDLAGRVYKGVPAPTNLEIPPYRYVDENLLVIGENPGAGDNEETA